MNTFNNIVNRFFVEENLSDESNNVIMFMFYEGGIPVNDKIVDFDKFEKKYSTKYANWLSCDVGQMGVILSIIVPPDFDSEDMPTTIRIPSVIEFMEYDPEGIYTIWNNVWNAIVEEEKRINVK